MKWSILKFRPGTYIYDPLSQEKAGIKVNVLVHLQSLTSKIFFRQQTGETTSKFFPFVWET